MTRGKTILVIVYWTMATLVGYYAPGVTVAGFILASLVLAWARGRFDKWPATVAEWSYIGVYVVAIAIAWALWGYMEGEWTVRSLERFLRRVFIR